MKLNGSGLTIGVAALTGILTVFVMLFTGVTGKVDSNVKAIQINRERLAITETKVEIMQEDVREILDIVRSIKDSN